MELMPNKVTRKFCDYYNMFVSDVEDSDLGCQWVYPCDGLECEYCRLVLEEQLVPVPEEPYMF